MPVPRENEVPERENSKQLGVNKSLLYNGSVFRGFQKSKGNSYEVEVVLQVMLDEAHDGEESPVDLEQSPVRKTFFLICEVNENFQLSLIPQTEKSRSERT